MSDMKCPICGKDLVEIELGECWFLVCCNSKCRCKGVASDTVWEYIDRTRKALYLAFETLKDIKNDPDTNDELTQEIADRLDEITALMQGGQK